jgi:hypothetical protein
MRGDTHSAVQRHTVPYTLRCSSITFRNLAIASRSAVSVFLGYFRFFLAVFGVFSELGASGLSEVCDRSSL